MGIWAIVHTASAQPQPQPTAEADALIERGLAQREAGHDEEALALFQQAFERAQTPRARAQVALAEQALGRWVDAEAHLTEALAARNDPFVRRNRSALEGALRVVQTHLGSVEVRGGIEGASVHVNGREAGTLPLAQPIRVVAGTLTLDVRAQGHYPIQRQVTVAPGAVVRESVEMRPEPVTASNAVAPPPTQQERVRWETVQLAGPQRTLGWVTLSVGALALVGGTVAHVLSNAAASEWNDDTRCLPANTTRYEACGDVYDRAQTLRPFALTGFLTGGVLSVLGVVLVATAPRASHTMSATAPRPLDCGMGPGSYGLSCGVRF